ncbi:thiosulfate/3-mercaptopyruvate sulfurtransferase [Bacillus sp. OV194]|nr:thiosulfate/3-mercaptopyruvate sulfurtransferase [Bacillus sp. OV194]
MKNIVTQEWLESHLSRSELVICDCRYSLSDPEAGRKQYDSGHIPGSIYVDLEKDLSRSVTEHGGRHPLPSKKEMSQAFGRLGIDEKKTVIAYDDQGGSYAARLWWMLKLLGSKKVFILQEGFSAWERKGYPVTSENTVLQPMVFTPQESKWRTVSMEEVRLASLKDGKEAIVVDSRDPERYKGKHEPIDKKAGHIPGAMNIPWLKNVSEGSKWLDSSELKCVHKGLKEKPEVIVYCGSGVTACANILGMDEAGIENVRLYPGSWSDWISYPENKIEKQ